ncbi:VOC family protein [Pseudofrankia sp. DC12]|uniref:VOC family protein n=1 Tax=Pseudofrankia sp. DC12 TaxID=683315 RepID=UPI0005F7FB1B|nr:VOC family protein [Pseudofrankia sp. DC12]
MAEFTSYEPGTPSWVDLASSDLASSKAFYGALFGWEAQDVPDPAAGGYGFFLLRGKLIAGYGPTMAPGQPSAWATYVQVDDADKTAEAVRGAGGSVVAGPVDIPGGAGRMAVCTDREGAFFSVFQPDQHKGAQLANEPGAFCWNELDSRDIDAAKAFYPAVFDWTVEGSADGGWEYYEWKRGGTATVAGMMPMPPGVPAQVPPYWVTYFGVTDTDAAVAEAGRLGATTVAGPMDSPAGRLAVLSGPQGEVFAIIKL